MFRELCGDAALKNVVLVTNMWREDSRDTNEAREKELARKFFKPVLDKGAQMVRHYNTVQSAHDIIRKIAVKPPIVLRIQRELVDKRKSILDTAAGKAINRELNEQIRRHRAELKEVQEEMKQALRDKDEVARQELEEEKRRLQERMEEIAKDSKGMPVDYAAEKKRMEARVKEVEQEAKRREQDDANRARRLQGETVAPVTDQPRLALQTKRLQELPSIPVITPPDPTHRKPPQRPLPIPPRIPSPQISPHIPSPQILSQIPSPHIPSSVASYVLFCLATRGH